MHTWMCVGGCTSVCVCVCAHVLTATAVKRLFKFVDEGFVVISHAFKDSAILHALDHVVMYTYSMYYIFSYLPDSQWFSFSTERNSTN